MAVVPPSGPQPSSIMKNPEAITITKHDTPLTVRGFILPQGPGVDSKEPCGLAGGNQVHFMSPILFRISIDSGVSKQTPIDNPHIGLKNKPIPV